MDFNFEGTFVEGHYVNKSLYKNVLCHLANSKSVFFIFISIPKATNTLNSLTNIICEIYVFYLSYPIVFFFFFFHWQINTYLLTYSYSRWRLHYVKGVRIWNYSGPYFPAFGLNKGDTEYLSVLSLNAGKYRPE